MFKEAAQKAQGTSPAYQLAQNPVFNNRDGARLYDALSRQLDAEAMTTIDNYYAKQVGDKLKNRGVAHPSQELVMGLAKAWLGRRPEGDMRTAVFNYLV